MSGPIFVLHIWCGKIFAESLSMIDCYISQIQTSSQRVSLSMFEFSSPAFFSFQVHKRPVYLQLEILSHPYCLISFQNPSAQYHFCHIGLPQDIFGNGTPCWNSELSSVYWASLTTSSLWCKSSHTDRPEFNLSFPVLILFVYSSFCAIVLCLSHGADENVSIDTSAKPLVLAWPEEIVNEDH